MAYNGFTPHRRKPIKYTTLILLSLIVLIVLAYTICLGEEVGSYWIRTISGPGDDKGFGIALDDKGYIYIVGYTESYGVGGRDAFIAKLSPDGSIVWFKTMGSDLNEHLCHVSIVNNYMYVIGTIEKSPAGDTDILIAKLTLEGKSVWIKTIGGTKRDGGCKIAVDLSGDIIICGITKSYGHGDSDVVVAKLSPEGEVKWTKVYGGSGWDGARDVVVDSEGNIYVLGVTDSFGAGDYDVFVMKLTSTGKLKWFRVIGGYGEEKSYDMTIGPNGYIYITGHTYSYGAGGDGDIFLGKLDRDGNIVWFKTLGGMGWDSGVGVDIGADGFIYLTGFVTGLGEGDDICVAKIDKNDDLVWFKTIGGSGWDETYDIDLRDGIIYMPGFSDGFSEGSYDILVIAFWPGITSPLEWTDVDWESVKITDHTNIVSQSMEEPTASFVEVGEDTWSIETKDCPLKVIDGTKDIRTHVTEKGIVEITTTTTTGTTTATETTTGTSPICPPPSTVTVTVTATKTVTVISTTTATTTVTTTTPAGMPTTLIAAGMGAIAIAIVIAAIILRRR